MLLKGRTFSGRRVISGPHQILALQIVPKNCLITFLNFSYWRKSQLSYQKSTKWKMEKCSIFLVKFSLINISSFCNINQLNLIKNLQSIKKFAPYTKHSVRKQSISVWILLVAFLTLLKKNFFQESRSTHRNLLQKIFKRLKQSNRPKVHLRF